MSDGFLYKTFARRETHPARLGALARLQGLQAAPARACSVLEIGCGDGGNVLPLAARYPGSRFVGVDTDEHLIEKGRREAVALGLTNISFECGDIRSYSAGSDTFDYIVCHGVFSWVSTEAQSAILATASAALTPEGVLFVSYNTFPGWRQRGALGEILRKGAHEVCSDDMTERYAHAMSALSRAVRGGDSTTGLEAHYLRDAYERLRNSEPAYVVQEFLGEYNTPFLFRDFMKVAGDYRLQFLSESRVVMMSVDDLSPLVRQEIDALGDDIIAREQALDMIRNRTFRETLLCRSERSLQRGLRVEAFKALTMVAQYIPVDPGDVSTQAPRFQERTSGRELETPAGECSDVLRWLAACGPRGATFADLFDKTRGELSLSERDLLIAVVTLWRSGFIDLLTEPLIERAHLDGTIKVAPWTTLQCEVRSKVTSALHDSYPLSAIEQKTLMLASHGMTCLALRTQLLADLPEQEVDLLLMSLYERGFFI
jgi:trans-aconitate methyltransferase